VSPIRNTDDTAPAELAACRLWERRLERELADLRAIIEGLERETQQHEQ
jgi:cob(I)alamin adenosyltransferase